MHHSTTRKALVNNKETYINVVTLLWVDWGTSWMRFSVSLMPYHHTLWGNRERYGQGCQRTEKNWRTGGGLLPATEGHSLEPNFTFHPGCVHPLQDVAPHQCLPLSSVCCFPIPGGSLLPCYVVLPSSAWPSPWSLPSPWLPLYTAFSPPIVLHSSFVFVQRLVHQLSFILHSFCSAFSPPIVLHSSCCTAFSPPTVLHSSFMLYSV